MIKFNCRVYRVGFVYKGDISFICKQSKKFFGEDFVSGILTNIGGNKDIYESILSFEDGVQLSKIIEFKEYLESYDFDKGKLSYISNFVDFDQLMYE